MRSLASYSRERSRLFWSINGVEKLVEYIFTEHRKLDFKQYEEVVAGAHESLITAVTYLHERVTTYIKNKPFDVNWGRPISDVDILSEPPNILLLSKAKLPDDLSAEVKALRLQFDGTILELSKKILQKEEYQSVTLYKEDILASIEYVDFAHSCVWAGTEFRHDGDDILAICDFLYNKNDYADISKNDIIGIFNKITQENFKDLTVHMPWSTPHEISNFLTNLKSIATDLSDTPDAEFIVLSDEWKHPDSFETFHKKYCRSLLKQFLPELKLRQVKVT